MEYWIGLLLGAGVVAFANLVGLDCGRSFYPTVAIVVASYYVLFAAMGAPTAILWIETGAASAFVLVAVIGFKTRFWLVAAAIFGHGIFDFFHHRFIDNPGVPTWWPGFCLAFDVAAGAWVFVRSSRGNAPPHQPASP